MGRFDTLKNLRDEVNAGEQDTTTPIEQGQTNLAAIDSSKSGRQKKTSTKKTISKPKAHVSAVLAEKADSNEAILDNEKRKVGRPKGRRSDPDYTQISAYIPLDLLISVQDVLAQERLTLRKRTPRPVSELIEKLLTEWLNQQNGKNSKN